MSAADISAIVGAGCSLAIAITAWFNARAAGKSAASAHLKIDGAGHLKIAAEAPARSHHKAT